MEQVRRLYRLDRTKPRVACDAEVKCFRLSPFHLFLDKEKRSLNTLLIRLMWWQATGGRAKIYYITEKGVPVHTSYVIPQCRKFPFLGENDYEIGPCFTDETMRGKGYYPQTLDYIIRHLPADTAEIYMIVNDENEPSKRGIMKAGFVETGYCVTRSRTGKHIKTKISDKGNDQ